MLKHGNGRKEVLAFTVEDCSVPAVLQAWLWQQKGLAPAAEACSVLPCNTQAC